MYIYFLIVLAEVQEESATTSGKEACETMGNFSIIVQIILFVSSLIVLVIKRQCESPKRKWVVWLLDLLKQVFSATFQHFINIFLSLFFENDSADECSLFFINTLTDTTIGVFYTFIVMKSIDYIISKFKLNVKFIL